MPTYDYACDACGHRFELFQSITAAPVKKCPACGKRSVQRLLGTGAGILFKGSGFYQTDYRSESYKQAAKAEAPAKADAGAKPDSPSKGDKPAEVKAGGAAGAGQKTAASSGKTTKPRAAAST
jgi:putative FmdB family regulatory protein